MGWSYLPHTPEDRAAMLAAIGAQSVAELFSDIPDDLLLGRKLDLPDKMDEAALLKHLGGLAAQNANFHEYASFLGAGVYDHYLPVVVDSILNRSEFYTAYTQYQPEVAQGYLQALWEYQSMICSLTGMQVANASLYDGGTAMAEAALLAAAHSKRNKLAVAKTVHPHYRAILETYARDRELVVTELDSAGGVTPAGGYDADNAAVIIQTPNFFGCLEDIKTLADAAHQAGALLIAAADPVSLGILAAPGSLGADIVVGEGQALGIPASFGGPGVGFLASAEKFMRKLPGRIVGQTTDSEGRRGFVLTLQAREQHIRREKATSNICSNQALCALAAAVYMSAVGPRGLAAIAGLALQKAHYAAEKLSKLPGCALAFPAPFFKEFVIRLPRPVPEINAELLRDKIIGGLDLEKYYPELKNCALICVTENRSKEEIDRMAERLGAVV